MNGETNTFLEDATRTWASFLGHIAISAGIIVFSIVTAILVGSAKSPEEAKTVEEVLPTVKTEIAQRETGGITFQIDGVVVPFREVVVASEVSGNIALLASSCRTGRYVQKGEILAEIDRRDYQHALEEARQKFIQADREIEEWKVSVQNNLERLQIAREQFSTQKQESERCQKLHQQGAVSQTELETAMLNLLTKKESVVTLLNENKTLHSQKERLDANREAMRIAVEKAELNLTRCTIKSPLTGLVVGLDVEQDKFIQRGETLVTIHDTSRLEVQCSLYMKQVEWLWSENQQEKLARVQRQGTHAALLNASETPARGTSHTLEVDSALSQANSVITEADSALSNRPETNEKPEANENGMENEIKADSGSETGTAALPPSNPAPELNAAQKTETLRQFYQFDDTPVKLQYVLDGTIYQWQGTLTYLDGPGLDSRTRMMPCRVVVENPLNVKAFTEEGTPLKHSVSPTLMPGMFVTIEIHANPARPLLNLSEMAVLPGGTVWKVRKDENGRNVLVRASKIATAHFDTKSGRILVYRKRGVLEDGDQVIVSPLASPVEGTFVHVMNQETPSETAAEKAETETDPKIKANPETRSSAPAEKEETP